MCFPIFKVCTVYQLTEKAKFKETQQIAANIYKNSNCNYIENQLPDYYFFRSIKLAKHNYSYMSKLLKKLICLNCKNYVNINTKFYSYPKFKKGKGIIF